MLAREIKEKMKAGIPSIGTWTSIAHPSNAEILALAGYDWVVIDTEHSAIDVSQVMIQMMAVKAGGSVPFVRLAGNDPIQAKAVLDSGAAGILVPMINTPDEAEQAVRMTKYPPLGNRGVGLARAQEYGATFDEYVQSANADGLLILQIEHKDAVANIDAILEVEGVDGTFIGPYDLSMSLGIPGQLTHPDLMAARKKVLDATRRRGLAAGIHFVHPSVAGAESHSAIAEGYTFIAVGTDLLFLSDSARSLKKAATPP